VSRLHLSTLAGHRVVILAALAVSVASLQAAVEPLASATVSRVENRVSYGKVVGDKSETRPAGINDVVKANNFLLSEADSRAELRYEDGTIVRIGQNTIFTFEANTRTLNLKKGTFVFYVPKGKGGGTIKTPSFTAAITGTIGKVSNNIIAVIEGEVTLVPSGKKVPEGFFARFNPDGTIEILPFDRAKEFDGKLMTFNGPLPGLPEAAFGSLLTFFTELGYLESQDRTQNLPSQVLANNPLPVPTATPKQTSNNNPPPPPAPTPTPRPVVPPPPLEGGDEGGGL
jgi:hypothetical protein